MMLFWFVAALLLVLALGVIASALLRQPVAPARGASASNLAILKAQWRQLDLDLAGGATDAAQHALARAEIERRLLEEESVALAPVRSGSPRATLAWLMLAVPLLALALYGLLGNLQALAPAATAAPQLTRPEVEALVARLDERMRKQPPGQVADVEGWALLGRTYAGLQRYPQAVQAFDSALQLLPKDAQLLADKADALAMQQGQNLQGEPTRLVEQALQSDPSNLKALALSGSAAFDRHDYTTALRDWGRARELAPADGDFARGLERSLAEAQAAAASSGLPGAAARATASASAHAANTISGRVSLAPALAARVASSDTVFIFARAAEGPRMPLAILKRKASELPIEFTLDDSMAMSPEMKLSNFASVVLGARISKSGDAMPQSGDLQGQVGPLSNPGGRVELRIDGVKP
jgi:cytochrome c-type biogenesis protein CcmH